MIESIEFSKPYGLKLLEMFGGTLYNCVVIGTTNIDNVVNNQDEYNIYTTYYKPLGLGLTTYYSTISESTPIYICKAVKSFEPFELEQDEKFFVPASLIDMEKSVEYVECNNLNIIIYPFIRRFATDVERDNYMTDLKSKVRRKLKELIDFSIIENEIDVGFDTTYLSKEDITDIETRRAKAFKEYAERIAASVAFDNTRASNYNKLMQDMKKSKEDYDIKAARFEERTIELEDAIKAYTEATKQITG